MIGENSRLGRSMSFRALDKDRKRVGSLLQQQAHSFLANKRGEQAIMARSKPKREKREETTEEFVRRMNLPLGKRNGLKKNLKGARR